MFASAAQASHFSDIYIPYDFEFLVAQFSGHEVVTLSQVFRVHSGSELHFIPVLDWTRNTELTLSDLNLHLRRHDLHRLIVKAAVINHVSSFDFTLLTYHQIMNKPNIWVIHLCEYNS